MKKKTLLTLLFLASFAVPACCGQEAASDDKKIPRTGVLLLAHGGHMQTWNEEVRHVADQVDLTVPTEVAFGMANRATMEEGIHRLIARGVTEIIAVPLFVSSHSSVIDGTAYLLGLREQGPDDLKELTSMDHASPAAGKTMAHDPAEMADRTKPIATEVPVRMASALDHAEIVADILSDRAASISKDPPHEVVLLVAHGPVPDADNKLWLHDMDALADHMRKRTPYARIESLTLRDDADDPVRDAATQQLQETVKCALHDGNSVLVVPLLLSYGGIEGGLRKRLAGLDFKMPAQALLPDPRIALWVTSQMKKSADTTIKQ